MHRGNMLPGHAIAQAVSRRLPTMQAQVSDQVRGNMFPGHAIAQAVSRRLPTSQAQV
jgi:hypothetical protein